ncbi:glutelin type-A 1-like [Iris pallida]|uniref:Glutelin type-A 1-like n=1 Tax=Iris pallida TaxID=29817 RepID=A0AAX6G297_IRIPA|nr:glutelin type-A 1-like [Iris pallida]KAJ6822839.1 glutelin type-A 1-like [Iris pallida]
MFTRYTPTTLWSHPLSALKARRISYAAARGQAVGLRCPCRVQCVARSLSPITMSIQIRPNFSAYINPQLYCRFSHLITTSRSKKKKKFFTMAMANFLCFSLAFLLLSSHASLADQFGESQEGRRLGTQSQCRIERLRAQEPRRRIDAEAGFTEHFDENDEQFDCAGVSAFRRTIQPGGLVLPFFSNSPILLYVLRGSGIVGTIIPGCPETFQSFQQHESEHGGRKQGQRFRDQHQKIHHFREGDVIAIPAGVSHWCYNDGESAVVTINVVDTSNQANQLDRNHRQFLLAGSQQSGGQQGESERGSSGRNILGGFDPQMLADAIGIRRELVEKIQGREDNRGNIVKVRAGELQVLRPSESRQSEEDESQEESSNGLEQAVCSMKIRENIRKASRADVYNPDAGRITSLNSQKLPILRFLRLSAEWGTLKRNAITPPQWNVNAHSVRYIIKGTARCQVVDDRGRAVFDGELRQGQILVVPQNFPELLQSRSDDFEWVSIKTNDNAMVNQIVGRGSAMKSMPVDVIMNSYRVSREEARMVKENRGQEVGVFSPRSQGKASA